MRQAGRYLPEYRAIRAQHDFLTMVRTPELAAQITLQPVDVLGVDAAILFSDILVIPAAMGMALSVEEGTGPAFHHPIRNEVQLARLRPLEPHAALAYQLDAIRMARRALADRVPLIGFAGGPWTLACYAVEGGATREYRVIRRMLAECPALLHRLLELFTTAVIASLRAQVEAGAQVLQVFESSAAALGPRGFQAVVLPHLSRVVRAARAAGVPVIAFAPGASWDLPALARDTTADVIGIDWQTAPSAARTALSASSVACQGNLDPAALFAAPAAIRKQTAEMIEEFGATGYIVNLGHGVMPETPVAHVREFVAAAQGR
jgi:uroporphyrinogen decarboxylase